MTLKELGVGKTGTITKVGVLVFCVSTFRYGADSRGESHGR